MATPRGSRESARSVDVPEWSPTRSLLNFPGLSSPAARQLQIAEVPQDSSRNHVSAVLESSEFALLQSPTHSIHQQRSGSPSLNQTSARTLDATSPSVGINSHASPSTSQPLRSPSNVLSSQTQTTLLLSPMGRVLSPVPRSLHQDNHRSVGRSVAYSRRPTPHPDASHSMCPNCLYPYRTCRCLNSACVVPRTTNSQAPLFNPGVRTTSGTGFQQPAVRHEVGQCVRRLVLTRRTTRPAAVVDDLPPPYSRYDTMDMTVTQLQRDASHETPLHPKWLLSLGPMMPTSEVPYGELPVGLLGLPVLEWHIDITSTKRPLEDQDFGWRMQYFVNVSGPYPLVQLPPEPYELPSSWLSEPVIFRLVYLPHELYLVVVGEPPSEGHFVNYHWSEMPPLANVLGSKFYYAILTKLPRLEGARRWNIIS